MTAAIKMEEQVQGLAMHYLAVPCHQDVLVPLVTVITGDESTVSQEIARRLLLVLHFGNKAHF